jgi:hypothetical protein
MKNRVAWCVVGVLAGVLLIGGGVLLRQKARAHSFRLVSLPLKRWHFGSEPFEIGGCFGAPMLALRENVALGPVEVSWDTHWGCVCRLATLEARTALNGPPTSTPSGTGR